MPIDPQTQTTGPIETSSYRMPILIAKADPQANQPSQRVTFSPKIKTFVDQNPSLKAYLLSGKYPFPLQFLTEDDLIKDTTLDPQIKQGRLKRIQDYNFTSAMAFDNRTGKAHYYPVTRIYIANPYFDKLATPWVRTALESALKHEAKHAEEAKVWGRDSEWLFGKFKRMNDLLKRYASIGTAATELGEALQEIQCYLISVGNFLDRKDRTSIDQSRDNVLRYLKVTIAYEAGSRDLAKQQTNPEVKRIFTEVADYVRTRRVQEFTKGPASACRDIQFILRSQGVLIPGITK